VIVLKGCSEFAVEPFVPRKSARHRQPMATGAAGKKNKKKSLHVY
jgi:hypothetical protein